MKKAAKIILITLLIAGLIFAAWFFVKSNNKGVEDFATEQSFRTSIESKSVATGKVVPEDEVEIVPQLSGILTELAVEEGDIVAPGDLIARIKVVPNEAALNVAQGAVRNAEIILENAEREYKRNKALFDQKLISVQSFNNAELSLSQARQNLTNARNDLRIIREGTTGGGATNTEVRATVGGTILQIPIEEGDQVIESNTFNPGTTIATIADLTKMIFEGKIDEADVAKLTIGMPLTVKLAAIDDREFNATLRFIAPKGTEENGSVQFVIKGDVDLADGFYVRAGYSANASMVLERKEEAQAIREVLLQFDKKTEEPFVEVEVGEQEFERRDVKLGISDGINVEILEGISEADKIKIWNKTEPVKKGEEDKDA